MYIYTWQRESCGVSFEKELLHSLKHYEQNLLMSSSHVYAAFVHPHHKDTENKAITDQTLTSSLPGGVKCCLICVSLAIKTSFSSALLKLTSKMWWTQFLGLAAILTYLQCVVSPRSGMMTKYTLSHFWSLNSSSAIGTITSELWWIFRDVTVVNYYTQ